MKIKTSELTGPALDWAVAKAEGRGLQRNPVGAQGGHGWWIWEETQSGKGGILIDKSIYMELGPHTQPKTRNSGDRYSPSTDWAQGGPLIELGIAVSFGPQWTAVHSQRLGRCYYGPTPLIAICRCYVASKLGDEIEIPEELL